MRNFLLDDQTCQRAKIGFGGLMLVLVLGFLAGPTQARQPRMMPAYVADIYNESAREHTIVLRAIRTQEHIAPAIKVAPGGTAQVAVQPHRWFCGTRIEASIDGQPFQRLEREAEICQRNEVGDRPVIVIIEDRVELTHADVD